jgi:RNA polymerase primary sigma factor
LIADNIAYIKDQCGRYPLLTPTQEIELARQVQEAVALKAQLNEGKPNRKQARILHRGDRARDKMICCNLRLVLYHATKFRQASRNRYSSLDLADLFQLGCLGLHTAVDRYDPTRGYKFSTYAYWWIRQSCHRYGGDIDHAIRLPADKREMIAKVLKAKAELGPNGTTDQALEAAGCTRAMWDVISVARMMPVFLDAPAGDTEDGHKAQHELIADTRSPMSTRTAERIKVLRDAVERIPNAKTQFVLKAHFGLCGYAPKTMEAIGKELGLSRERIRQLKETGLGQLRFHARNFDTELRYEAA